MSHLLVQVKDISASGSWKHFWGNCSRITQLTTPDVHSSADHCCGMDNYNAQCSGLKFHEGKIINAPSGHHCFGRLKGGSDGHEPQL